ncbi:MAG: hypothetical protein ACOYJK_02400 [Prevotella sp.]|jgi:hypothetical protein
MEKTLQSYGKDIPEFDQSAILAQGDDTIPDCEPIYHDSFKECKELFDSLQAKLGDYNLLGLYTIGNGYLRCEKNGLLFLINKKTLKPMFDKPIEGALRSLNGPEFIVKKNGLSAVFDMDGIQLTEFVKGDFDWKWAPFEPLKGDDSSKRIIYNKEAGIELKPR